MPLDERPSVLVVEDDDDVRAAIRDALLEDGFRVTTARNGEAGLAVLRMQHPDLVILDLILPGMQGWEFRERQLDWIEARDIPVIVATGSSDYKPPSRRLAPAATLRKPLDLDKLIATARRVLEQPSPA